jgi:hypothetical protein
MLSGQWLRRPRPRDPSVVIPGAVFKHPARLVAGAETTCYVWVTNDKPCAPRKQRHPNCDPKGVIAATISTRRGQRAISILPFVGTGTKHYLLVLWG